MSQPSSVTSEVSHCPNPACAYRQRFHRAAEYRAGFEHCSDCGSKLIEGAEPASSVQASAPAPLQPAPWTRLGVTLATGVAVMLAWRIPLSGGDDSLMGPLTSMARIEPLRLGALAFEPALAGFVLVEALALVLVPRLRLGGFKERLRLRRAAWIISTGIALLQAAGMVTDSRELPSRAFLTLLLAAPSVLAYPLADLLSRRALGSGFSVLLVASFLPGLLQHAARLIELFQETVLSLGTLALVPVAVGAIFELTRRFVRVPREGALEVPVPAGSIVPLVLGAAMLTSVAGTAKLMHAGAFSRLLTGLGRLELYIWDAVVLAAATLLLGALYNRRGEVAEVWAREARLTRTEAADEAGLALLVAMGRSVLFLGLVYAVIALLFQLGGQLLSLMQGSLVVMLAAVGLDLWAEWRFRREHGALFSARPVHRVYEVPAILRTLRAADVPVLPRGFHHRALLQFFGPYVPIELFVPESRRQDALRVLSGEPA